MRSQRGRPSLVPWGTSLALALAVVPATAQTAQTPQPPATTATPPAAQVVSDAVNVPVQVKASVLGTTVVDTQQILRKSSLDLDKLTADAAKKAAAGGVQAPTPDQTATPGPVRFMNELNLDNVGLRVDLAATSWAKKPGTIVTATDTSADRTDALVHAALEGAAEAVVRLGPANTEIVSVSGQDVASAAGIGGSCGSLTPTSTAALGTTSLRVLGVNVPVPANPEPNTAIALTDIPGLASGTLILNEQTKSGDGVNTQIVAVAPLRLQLRLGLAGLGGLADVEVSLGGNSVAVDCGTSKTPAPTPSPTPTATTPTQPTTPTQSPTTAQPPTTVTPPATSTLPTPR